MSSNKSSEESNDTNSNSNSNINSVTVVNNKFANDGSFLEMFKKMQRNSSELSTESINTTNTTNRTENCCKSDPHIKTETETKANDPNDAIDKDIDSESQKKTSDESTAVTTHPIKKSSFLNTNKRKTKTLKTGIIKKQRNEDSDEEDKDGEPADAWNHYMKEVRKYKEKYGDDNDKNRPLVK